MSRGLTFYVSGSRVNTEGAIRFNLLQRSNKLMKLEQNVSHVSI